MQINITDLFRNAYPKDYSASAHELGQNAGAITWTAAKDDASDWLPAFSADELNELRAYFKGFGAWDESELAAMDATELSALLLQCIAGDIRECGIDTSAPDWDEYEEGASAGRYAGRMFLGYDGQVYYHVGD